MPLELKMKYIGETSEVRWCFQRTTGYIVKFDWPTHLGRSCARQMPVLWNDYSYEHNCRCLDGGLRVISNIIFCMCQKWAFNRFDRANQFCVFLIRVRPGLILWLNKNIKVVVFRICILRVLRVEKSTLQQVCFVNRGFQSPNSTCCRRPMLTFKFRISSIEVPFEICLNYGSFYREKNT